MQNKILIGLAVFLLGCCMVAVYSLGKKAGYGSCLQEFSPDGGKMYPDAWK